MQDSNKTKKVLINELAELQERIAKLEHDNAERRKKEHALQLTQFTVDHAADAVFWMGPDSRFFYVNAEACRSLGYSREELLSMTVHDIDPNFPPEKWEEHWDNVRQRGSSSFESRHRAKDGTTFPVEIMVNHLKFDDIEYNCAFARNISERKRIEENLSRSRYFSETLISSLPGIFYLFDENGKYHKWNKNFENVTEYSAEEIRGMKPLDFFLGDDLGIIAEKIREVFDKGEASAEADLVTNSGRKIRYYFTGRRLIIDDKFYITGMGIDISEIKKIHDALVQARQEWENIFQAIGHPTVILDVEQSVLSANKAAMTVTGKDLKDIVGKKCYELFHGTQDPPEGCPFEKMLASGSFETEPMEMRALGGVYLVSCTPVLDNEGRLQKVIHIATDITEQKRAEEALEHSEEKYRSFVQNFQGIAYKGNMDFTAIFFHGQLEKITGYTEEALVGGRQRWDQIIHPDDLPGLKESFEKISSVPGYSDVREYRIIHKSGQVRWVRERIRSVCDESGKPAFVQGTIQDITVEKTAEISLRESEKKYRGLIDALQEGLWMIDNNGMTTFVNDSMAEMLGYTPEEMLGKSVFSFMDEYWVQVCEENVKRRRKGIKEQHDFEFIKKDGSPLYVTMAASPVCDEDGCYIGGIAGVINITERKKIEEELMKFKFISDNANDAYFLVDSDARFRYVNETACRMFGYSKEELLSLKMPDVDVVYDIEKYRELFSATQEDKIQPIQTVNKKRDGTVFCSEISLTGYRIGGEQYLFAALRDITERKAAEELITQSLKEKELLMKEMNHRIKNNMSVVSSLLRLQSAQVKDEKYKTMFTESVTRIKTMALIHEKLYQSEELSKVMFSDYIKDTAIGVFKSYGMGPRVRLVTDIESIALEIDASLPCGLIVNELITNSMKYAFPDGMEGELTVSLHLNRKGEVELKVQDNGVGISEELDVKVHDSLGLRLINSLVAQLGGVLKLSRENGTEFAVTFKP